jgi:potassium-dependent mechanosensitive channel
MNTGNNEQTEIFFELFLDQINIILAVISRPVVQQQIFAFMAILVISWLAFKGIMILWNRNHSSDDKLQIESLLEGNYWLTALYLLITQILALIFLYIAIAWFTNQGLPHSLLQKLTVLIWLWTLYRFLITLLYARFGESMRPYRNWIMTPIFLFLATYQILSILPGSIVLVDAIIFFGETSVTVRNLLVALIILYIFGVAAWVVEQIMDNTLPGLLNADPGVVQSIAILARYALLGFGILFSLGMLGLDFTSLAIIAGGLSVGIGIGLQEYVANFVSGLVILFEQTVRPGDVVEVDGLISQVEKISLRATTVRTSANEEIIIPNSNFTTQTVKNLTKSERRVRIRIPFEVSIESDPELIGQLTTEASLEHPLVLPDPPPLLFFRGFGNSGLDFELSISISHPELMGRVKSDLYYKLWEVFTEHKIEIPNPQRDINLGNGWEKFTMPSER